MKFKLLEVAGLSSPSGQTTLKSMIATAVNNDLFTEIDPDNYCVHHLNGDHHDNSPKNVSITTKENHARITNFIRYGNWQALEKALQNCFIIKARAQKLIQSDAHKIVNSIKRSRKIYIDSNGIKWVVTPDIVAKYSAIPLDYRHVKQFGEILFESDDELKQHMRLNKWKRVA